MIVHTGFQQAAPDWQRRRVWHALLLGCLFAMLLFSSPPAHAEAEPEAQPEADFPCFIDGRREVDPDDPNVPTDAVSVFANSNGYTLFLPAGWDCDWLRVLCGMDETVLVDDTAYSHGDFVSLSPGRSFTMSIGNTVWEDIQVLQSAAVPSVFLTTDTDDLETMYRNKRRREPGACMIWDADGTLEYDGRLEYVRTRGNSTSTYPKKPFQIKLESPAPLFGMNSDRQWVLLANYTDKSLIRTTVALDLARYANVYRFVPGAQAVDLFLNHQYTGSYLLTEKREIDKDRLDITDLESETELLNPGSYDSFTIDLEGYRQVKGLLLENNPDDVTGGYLVLATIQCYYDDETSGFRNSHEQYFTIDSPKGASLREVLYISKLFQQIEDAIFSNDSSWKDLLDETTFVHRYLQAEVTADNDGILPFFYKDADAIDPKVYCGPVWDQDNIWGVNTGHQNPECFYIQDTRYYYSWFPEMMRHPEFEAVVRATYRDVYAPALEILLGQRTDPRGVLRSLDEYAADVSASAALDNVRWPIANNRGFNFNLTGDTPEENIEFLRDYITRRKHFLDSQWLD